MDRPKPTQIAVVAVAVAVAGFGAHRIMRAMGSTHRPTMAPACPAGTALVKEGRFIVAERYDSGVVDDFCMDLTEVTVAAYAACVAAKGCTEPDAYKEGDLENLAACNWQRPGFEQHPVNCVDWHQATEYCAWAKKRLPTEDEWEWAARSGAEARIYPWGSAPPGADRLNACGSECLAWAKAKLGKTWTGMYTADDGWPTTAPVGSFPNGATPLGIQDMAGNVWEWTATAFDAKNRVTRGGGWSDFKLDRIRVTHRGADLESNRTRSLGFRCAG